MKNVLKSLLMVVLCHLFATNICSQNNKRIDSLEFEKLKRQVLELQIEQSKGSSVMDSRGMTNDEAGKSLTRAGFWNTLSIVTPIIGSVFIYSTSINIDPENPNYSGVIVSSSITGIITIGANIMVSINLFEAGRALKSK